ncbi:DUF4199 domain-containing protein [Fulvivirgaceae bacterium BMA12]|uniref:DUF4199 domain-containing protein n=1 Tax=Agaribacillus aureus TaxID=3051825 RepID=A0ABT8LDM3_9BACT|nr:DUF4199 domain-containing protein [Fulvivirgaceae bacterium BMA12]
MEQKPTVFQTGLKYGLILALINIGVSLITNLAGQGANQWLAFFIIVIFFAIVCFMAHKAFKDNGDGFMSYGQGLGIGAVMGLVAGLLSSIFSAIYVSYIDNSAMEEATQKQIEKMEERGMSDAQIDQAVEMMSMFQTPVMIVGFGLLYIFILGFIISLIVSAITKNSNPEAEL